MWVRFSMSRIGLTAALRSNAASEIFYVTLILGPRFMKHRKMFDRNKIGSPGHFAASSDPAFLDSEFSLLAINANVPV